MVPKLFGKTTPSFVIMISYNNATADPKTVQFELSFKKSTSFLRHQIQILDFFLNEINNIISLSEKYLHECDQNPKFMQFITCRGLEKQPRKTRFPPPPHSLEVHVYTNLKF